MTRRRRRLLVVLSLLALAGLAAAALIALPRAVHAAVASELRAQGFPAASFRVRRVGWAWIELADVRLAGDLSAEAIRADFDPRRRTMESLVVSGARVDLDPSALDASSLARLSSRAGESSDAPPARVRLERARLVVAGDEAIELDGDVRPHEEEARLVVRSMLGEHEVAARVRTRGARRVLSLRARSSLDAARATVQWTRAGEITVDASAELGPGARGAGGPALRLEGGSLVAHARLDEGRASDLELHAQARGVSLDRLAIGDVEVRAAREEEAIAWSARLTAKDALAARIDGRAPLELARWTAPGPMAWQVSGPIDGALLERALPGVVFSPGPRVALAGTLRREPSRWILDAIDGTVQLDRLEVPGGDTSLEGVRARVAARASIGARVSLHVEPGTTVRAARLDIDELHASDLEVAPVLTVDARGGRASVTLSRDAAARMRRLAIGSGPAALRFHEARTRLSSREGAPIVDTGRAPHVRMRLDAEAPRVSGLLAGSAARGGGELTVTMRDGGADIALPLEVRAAALERPDAELSLESARLSLPLIWRRGVLGAEGSMRARAMRFRGVLVGEASGAVSVSADAVSLAWRAPATSDASFRLRGRFPFERGGGRVGVVVPRTVAREGDALTRILAELTDMTVTGPVEGEIDLDVEAPERGRARIVLQGAELAEVDGTARARGVHGTLRLAHLSPLASHGPDPVSWTELRIGDLVRTRAGTARLSFSRDGRVSVAAFDALAAGGRVRAAPFSFAWEEPDVALDLQLDGIDLSYLARSFGSGRVRASGELDGRVALRVKTGRERRVVLGDGRLDARGPGRIRFGAGTAADLDARSLEGVLEGEWLRERLASTLADFRYERLSLLLDAPSEPGRGGTTRLRARVVGRGARTRQELDLTLGVRGVQPLLDGALRLMPEGRASARIEARIDTRR